MWRQRCSLRRLRSPVKSELPWPDFIQKGVVIEQEEAERAAAEDLWSSSGRRQASPAGRGLCARRFESEPFPLCSLRFNDAPVDVFFSPSFSLIFFFSILYLFLYFTQRGEMDCRPLHGISA